MLVPTDEFERRLGIVARVLCERERATGNRNFIEDCSQITEPGYVVEPPALRGSWDPLVDREIADIFADYGTHVCPHAILGGWWKVSATYKSAAARQRSDVERILGCTCYNHLG